MNNNNSEPHTETIAETDNFLAWKAEEPDGETTYHVELNNVTVHFFEEEWTEFLQLVRRKLIQPGGLEFLRRHYFLDAARHLWLRCTRRFETAQHHAKSKACAPE